MRCILKQNEKANVLRRCFEQLAKMYIKAEEDHSSDKEHNPTVLKHWQRLIPHHAFFFSWLVTEHSIV